MSEKKTRKWPVQGNKYNYLTPEQASRAQELFEKYEDTIDEKYFGLSEDDATLFVAWETGDTLHESRWKVRLNRGETQPDKTGK